MTFYDKYKALGDDKFRVWLASYIKDLQKAMDAAAKVSRIVTRVQFRPLDLERPDLDLMQTKKS